MTDLTPDEFSRARAFEAHLRGALWADAERIVPADRLAQIHLATSAHPSARPRVGMPPWLLPVAASLLVVLVGLGTWVALRPSPPVVGPAAGPGTAITGSATTGSNTPSSAAPTTIATQATVSLPIYYIGTGSQALPWLLHRDFLPAQWVGDGSPSARATAAVTIAVSAKDTNGQALPAYPGLQQPWEADTTATATVTADEIHVVLSKPGRSGLTAEQQRIAVQQLVWTATAAASADLPVRIEVTGAFRIFEGMPSGVYKRPADTYTDLAPIWIIDPLRSTPITASKPVTAKVQACVFEGAFSWELRQGGTVVKSGHETTSGCPVRGTVTIALGRLTEGDYELRAFAFSAKDGSLDSEDVMPFHVGP